MHAYNIAIRIIHEIHSLFSMTFFMHTLLEQKRISIHKLLRNIEHFILKHGTFYHLKPK